MKKTIKKILCLALVLIMTVPFMAFGASATADCELISEVNFSSGDYWDATPTAGWGSMNQSIMQDGKAVNLKINNSKSEASVFGNALKTSEYEMSKSAYTTVFTVTAEDEYQEVGFFPDWQSGFAVTPGQNAYRYVSVPKNDNKRNNVEVNLQSNTYEGSGDLTQTYAIEVKDEGSGRGNYNITVYNLYVAKDGEWLLVCSLENASGIKDAFNWSSGDFEYVLRFFRNGMDSTQVGKSLVISDCSVYKGLAVTEKFVDVPMPDSYADIVDGGFIYKVNFNGTANFWSPVQGWGGMNAKASEDGSSVALTPISGKTEVGVWGAELPAESNKNADGKFRMLQSAYTVVFTLSAENANQEMGILLDWATGFAITPGNNSFRYVKGKQAETVFTGTYEGTKSLTQTYAIEIKDEGTATNINDHSTFSYNCTVYNLYVVQNGEWVKIFSLEDSTENAQKLKDALNWGSGDWEFVLRMFRDGLDENQINAMTISDMSVYKGLAIAEHDLVVPELPENEAPIYVQKSLDGTKIRFIGVVNISEEELDDFSKLGFDITMTYNGKKYTNTYTTTTVYTSLIANGTPVYASEYGGTYFYAIEITGLDAATSDVVFDVDGFTVNSGETTKNGFGGARVTFTPAS